MSRRRESRLPLSELQHFLISSNGSERDWGVCHWLRRHHLPLAAAAAVERCINLPKQRLIPRLHLLLRGRAPATPATAVSPILAPEKGAETGAGHTAPAVRNVCFECQAPRGGGVCWSWPSKDDRMLNAAPAVQLTSSTSPACK